ALAARARLALAQRDRLAAEALLRQAVEADPADADVRSLFATVALSGNRLDEAEDALDRAAELYRTRGQYAYAAPALLQLTRVQFAEGKVGEAADTGERLRARSAGSVQAHVASGLLAMRQGDTQRAVDEFRDAATIAPGQPEIEAMLGAANLAAGNLGQAEQ